MPRESIFRFLIHRRGHRIRWISSPNERQWRSSARCAFFALASLRAFQTPPPKTPKLRECPQLHQKHVFSCARTRRVRRALLHVAFRRIATTEISSRRESFPYLVAFVLCALFFASRSFHSFTCSSASAHGAELNTCQSNEIYPQHLLFVSFFKFMYFYVSLNWFPGGRPTNKSATHCTTLVKSEKALRSSREIFDLTTFSPLYCSALSRAHFASRRLGCSHRRRRRPLTQFNVQSI